MDAYQLSTLDQLFKHLAADHKMFEPQRVPGSSDQHWLPSNGDCSQFDSSNPKLPLAPAKGFLFPERELLFHFDGNDFIETLPEVEPQILFGLRSCDLCAISYQDQFFKQDPHYQARRNATFLVGFDCLTPCDGGFCSTVDAGPFIRDNTADLILLPAAQAWWLIAASAQGKRLIKTLDLPSAPANWAAEREEQQSETSKTFPSDNHIRAGINRINQADISAETWQRLGLQCLTCSGCSSLCPTCSCFTTFDQKTEASDDAFNRERCWDSCLYEAFQREASGHNPSLGAGERLERYWFHKFSDHYVEQFGRYGCIGCGRCEVTCPGGIGIHSIMHRLESRS